MRWSGRSSSSGLLVVGNIEDLADVERRDGVAEARADGGRGIGGDAFEFDGSVGAPDGGHSVGRGDVRDERHDKRAEERERQRVTHEVDQDEAAAGAAHVADELGEIGVREVMAHEHAVRDIGVG